MLHTLWFLLLIALLLGITLEIGRRTSEHFSSEKKQIERVLAEESIINYVIFTILEHGIKSVSKFNSSLNGQNFLVEVIPSHGLVDINTGSIDLLRQVARHISINQDRLLKLRKKHDASSATILNYADLTIELKLTERQFACFYPYVTLFSGRMSPIAQYIPKHLKILLGELYEENISIMNSDHNFTLGDSLRINIKPYPIKATGYYLSVDMLLTGRLDTPFFIRAWQQLPIC